MVGAVTISKINKPDMISLSSCGKLGHIKRNFFKLQKKMEEPLLKRRPHKVYTTAENFQSNERDSDSDYISSVASESALRLTSNEKKHCSSTSVDQ